MTPEPTWDTAHVRWQQVGSAAHGPTDQVRSGDGSDLGSRLYPRLVTAVLWLPPHSSGVEADGETFLAVPASTV